MWGEIKRAPVTILIGRQANTEVLLGGFQEFTTVIARDPQVIFEERFRRDFDSLWNSRPLPDKSRKLPEGRRSASRS